MRELSQQTIKAVQRFVGIFEQDNTPIPGEIERGPKKAGETGKVATDESPLRITFTTKDFDARGG